MKWWGWILLGLIAGVAGTLVVSANRTAAAVLTYQDSLATTRTAAQQRDSLSAQLDLAMNGLGASHDTAQRILDAGAKLAAAAKVAHDAAIDAEQRAKAALAVAQTSADSIANLITVVVAADTRALDAEAQHGIDLSQIEATGRLLGIVRDSVTNLKTQRDLARADANDYKRRANQADSLLAGKKTGDGAKWLGFLPRPQFKGGVGASIGATMCDCGEHKIQTGRGLTIGVSGIITL